MSRNMPATHMAERTTGPYLPAALSSVLVLTLMGLINLWDFKPIQWYHTLYTGSEGEWYHIKRQLFAAVAGVVAFCVLRRHTARLSRYRWVWAVLPLILLALPLMAAFLAAGFLGTGRSWQNIRIMYDYRQDPFGVGFETRRSIEDVRSGGLTGQGFGSYPMPVEDRPAYILPNTVSTFMLQITGRNLGLVGIGYVVLLLIILLGSGWVSATHQPDRFARMLGMGGISFLGFQALFSILRTLNLLPLMPAHAIPFFAFSQQLTLAAFMAMAFIFPGTPHVRENGTEPVPADPKLGRLNRRL
jgi:cell division protein FtsW (lipid II flippase)